MTELREIYAAYYKKAAEVRSKASPLAGIWGMGDDPRKDHCHDAFYEAVQDWVERFADPDPAAVSEAVRFILGAALAHKNEDVYWYLYAAHGLILPLIPRLRPADCEALFGWYDASYPKRDRLPVQQQVWKALKKGAK